MEFIKANKNPKEKDFIWCKYYYKHSSVNGPKVLLNEGWSKLYEFVDYLKNMKPLLPLEYNKNLALEIPEEKQNWTNKENFTKLIYEKKQLLNFPKYCFHFDIGYLNAEISAILQLVDDNTGFGGSRRKNILNPEVKQVGISNKLNGKKNCTYMLFIRSKGDFIDSTTLS